MYTIHNESKWHVMKYNYIIIGLHKYKNI